jgi:hypothetical protein
MAAILIYGIVLAMPEKADYLEVRHPTCCDRIHSLEKMPTKKTTKKVAAEKAPVKSAPAKKVAAKKAAKPAARKVAAKAPAKRAATEKGATEKAAASPEAVAKAAYLNYRRRSELGLPGDHDSDWLEAERSLKG